MNIAQLFGRNGLPPGLLTAQANAESGNRDFSPNGQPVISPAGAMYAMQVMPNTATNPGFGVTPAQDNSPQEFDRVGRDYISALHQHYGDLPTALAAYNWGPGNVDKYGAQNAPPETQDYVQKVMGSISSGTQTQSAPDTFDVQMPDGTTIKGVPKGTTQSQLQTQLAKLPAQPTDVNQSQPDLGMTHGVASNFAQGATFGLGDEAIAGTAALRSAWDRGSLSGVPDDYNDALNIERGSEKNFQSQHPLIALGSQLAGGLATGFAGGETAAGRAVASSLGEGSLGARIAKNAAVGAASGGLYGFGSGEGGAENRLDSAGKSALFGGAVGSAIPVAGAAFDALKGGASNIVRGVGAQDTEALQQASSDLHSAASPYYQKMRQLGDSLNDNATQKLVSNIDSSLNSAQNKFIPELNPKTMAVVNSLKDAAQNGNLGVSDIDQYRRLLGRIGGSEDGFSAGVVRSTLDSTLNGLGGADLASGTTQSIQLLNQARSASAQAFRYESVSDILQKANGDPNRIKAGLSRFVADDDNLKGFSDVEKAALKEAANTSVPENIIKALGKFGIDFSKSGTGNTVLPALMSLGKAGGAALVPGGIPAVVGATGMRQAGKYLARGKAQNVLDLIKNRAAAAAQTNSPQAITQSNPLALGIGMNSGVMSNLFSKMGSIP